MLPPTSWAPRQLLVLVALATLAACGGGAPVATDSPAPTEVPSTDEIAAAFLTPEEIGEGFSGEPPSEEDPEGVTVGTKPLCGIKSADSLIQMAAFSRTAEAAPSQVFERISVHEADDAALAMHRMRERAEARCSDMQKVGDLSYRMKVDGPILLPPLADEVAGLSQSYSRGYEGHRWTMMARRRRVTIYIEYTTPDEVDRTTAEEIFRAAVEKAASLD